MTKIDIISGFLGAGKTTLIKKLLSEALQGTKVVLIENEFGEIGVDGGFLKEAGIEIKEMNSGCICCSLVGDFTASLKEVLQKYEPERILIEPSGVGKLSDIQKAVLDITSESNVEAGFSVAVVDAKKGKMYLKNFGEFFKDQIAHAGTVFLSRTQGMEEEKVKTIFDMIRELNPKAKIVTTPWNELEGSYILDTIELHTTLEEEMMKEMYENFDDHDEECHCHDHHHDHDEECHCHEHHQDHDEECHCHEHHNDHDEECHCHEHHNDHDEECHCHEHHEEHDGECHCHENHEEHDGECHCHENHHDHDDEGHCGCHHSHHDHGYGHHHADEVFTSVGIETVSKFTKEDIERILHEFDHQEIYGQVLRAKGMISSNMSEWIYFDYTPGEIEIRSGAPEYTGKICVIGHNIKEEKIKELFQS